MKNNKLRMGVVGGGIGSFIGPIHRQAALLDNHIELVCGSFSSHPEVSRRSGAACGLPENRVYDTYQEMFRQEMQLPADRRMEIVSIVTPNKYHIEPAIMALECGMHVVLDKPLTLTLEEARQLVRKVEETGLQMAVTYTYSAYPAVKEARTRIARGELGTLRRLYVEYTQGWLSERIELQGADNARWRTDPELGGTGGTIADIGIHALHLAEHVTGQHVTELCAEANTFAPGRQVPDDGTAFLHFDGGMKGCLTATQIAKGDNNYIRIRVYGDKGGLDWCQPDPNKLILKGFGEHEQTIYIGKNTNLSEAAAWNTRTPGGHPEGYIEAFANIYRNFALTVLALRQGETPTPLMLDYPTVYDGLRGMQFIETMNASNSNKDTKWTTWIE
ncbi:MAG: Gfo/Idh/MocA family oxidoreductase [Prevotellaceae bacterium]|jgi:predicted dehydrogenase|nr:Gfo/Idh/MocA family oxidoreductase [Prevotellaceae bacterium]